MYIVGTRRRSFTLSFVFDVIDLCTRHPLHRGDFIVTKGGTRNDEERARERKSKEKPRLKQFETKRDRGRLNNPRHWQKGGELNLGTRFDLSFIYHRIIDRHETVPLLFDTPCHSISMLHSYFNLAPRPSTVSRQNCIVGCKKKKSDKCRLRLKIEYFFILTECLA